MDIVEGKKEKATTIVLDGKSFINCEFEDCTLVYHGGETAWVNTSIRRCNVQLIGAASNTANALRGLGWQAPESWSNPLPSTPAGLPN